jgi:hypothetical protein
LSPEEKEKRKKLASEGTEIMEVTERNRKQRDRVCCFRSGCGLRSSCRPPLQNKSRKL